MIVASGKKTRQGINIVTKPYDANTSPLY